MLAFTKSCQEPSCMLSSTVDFLLRLGIMEFTTKKVKKSIAWDFHSSSGSYIFSLLERERVEEQCIRSELDADYLPNMVLVSTNNMNTVWRTNGL